MLKYTVVTAKTLNALVRTINGEFIPNGWTPQGGISIAVSGNATVLAQAMVQQVAEGLIIPPCE